MMNMSIKIFKLDIFKMLLLSILFLFCLNFMNKGTYLYFILVLAFIVWMYAKRIKISITNEFFLLLLCFISYFLIYNIHFSIGLQMFITHCLGPILGYFIGYHIINKKSNICINNISVVIVSGLFIHGMLNMFLFFSNGITSRSVPDIWLGTPIAATLQGIFFTCVCSLLFYSIYIIKSKKNKVIVLLSILFSIYSSLRTASRTLLVITIVTFICNVIIYMYINKIRFNKIFKLIISVFLIISTIIVIYKFNIFNLKDFYEGSEFYNRINSDYITTLSEDPRYEMYKKTIIGIYDNPIGGDRIDGVRYAHNLWLDVGKKVGIIPFTLLILYTVMTLITMIKIIRNNNIEIKFKYLFASIYISMILNFMVEPILEGFPYIFTIMCIFNGATRYYLDSKKRSHNNESTMVM